MPPLSGQETSLDPILRAADHSRLLLLSRPVFLSSTLLGGALVAWVSTHERMHGMDAGRSSSPRRSCRQETGWL
jgi:hypothetical protein